MNANFLAIDLGASSGRVILGQYDDARFTLQELHRFENGGVDLLGHLHWDILRLWTEIKRGIAVYTRQWDAPLVSIGVDSWAVDYSLLDAHGRLLGNPYHYRDRRTQGMIERVNIHMSRAARYQSTGIQVLPFNTLYQLASQAADPLLGQAETLLLIPDLLHYWLTGRMAIEYTNASTTELLNCHTRQWDAELLERLGLPARLLPPVIAPGTVLGPVLPAVLREVGLSGAVQVVAPGTHDTASAVAGVPGLDAQSCYISSGTWSLVGVETTAPVTSAAARELNITNEGGVAGTIRLLKNVGGLWLLQESQRAWAQHGQQLAWQELLRDAAQAAPFASLIDPDAADFLSPADMPAAIRALCARTGQPAPATPAALARCCLESLALRYRWVIEALERISGQAITTIRIVGGGSQNQLLCQMTADACGRSVIAGPVEATAFGNLIVQAIASGYITDLAAGRRAIAASVAQDQYAPQHTNDWDAAYVRFQTL